MFVSECVGNDTGTVGSRQHSRKIGGTLTTPRDILCRVFTNLTMVTGCRGHMYFVGYDAKKLRYTPRVPFLSKGYVMEWARAFTLT